VDCDGVIRTGYDRTTTEEFNVDSKAECGRGEPEGERTGEVDTTKTVDDYKLW